MTGVGVASVGCGTGVTVAMLISDGDGATTGTLVGVGVAMEAWGVGRAVTSAAPDWASAVTVVGAAAVGSAAPSRSQPAVHATATSSSTMKIVL